ncbi:MAG: 50S ribosomal protein L18, partial [Candidatus Hodarchaeales archaeon]
ALKGIIDSGIDIPHSEKVFPDENRMNGQHIADYAKLLKKEDEDQYKSQFSKYIKLKIDPTKITEAFDKTVKEIKTNYQ